jgi:hypothetical protein
VSCKELIEIKEYSDPVIVNIYKFNDNLSLLLSKQATILYNWFIHRYEFAADFFCVGNIQQKIIGANKEEKKSKNEC